MSEPDAWRDIVKAWERDQLRLRDCAGRVAAARSLARVWAETTGTLTYAQAAHTLTVVLDPTDGDRGE